MDEIAILGRDDDRHSVKRFLAHYDVPAYVRRARQVEEVFDQLFRHCWQQREELLTMVRTRIGVLPGLAGVWDTHFNRRWGAFLQTLDLTTINELRDGYNRYYLLEKECALRSSNHPLHGVGHRKRLSDPRPWSIG